jgi:hypothetical protein
MLVHKHHHLQVQSLWERVSLKSYGFIFSQALGKECSLDRERFRISSRVVKSCSNFNKLANVRVLFSYSANTFYNKI